MTTAPSGFRIEQAMAAAQALRHHIQTADPELAADETALRDLLAEETDVYEVLRRLVRFAIESESLEEAAGKRASNLSARKARYGRRADMARGAILGMMDALGEKTLRDAEFTVTLRPGTAGVVITDETALPDEYVKISRSVNKAAVKDALKVGPVPGAEMQNGMPQITIRTA